MGYASIDPILKSWTAFHGLRLSKEYKEVEVRSVEVRSGRHDGWQIWIDKPDNDGLVGIHVWDFKRPERGGRRRDFLVGSGDLREYLDVAVKIAKGWADE